MRRYDWISRRIDRSISSTVVPGPARSSIGTISGGSATIRGSPSTLPVRFANTRIWSRVRAFAMSPAASFASRLPRRFAITSPSIQSMIRSASRWSYQASSVVISADARICRRYSPTQAMTIDRRSREPNPRSRPATSKLAARRFTSHSHGPGSVSSKSLMSNISLRSGEPNTPKFDRWASPQSCTLIPERGVAARSAAMISAPPRKNVNGETSIRP